MNVGVVNMGIRNHDLHDKDFYAWAKETAQLLKEGKFSEVDVMNIAEEIEELGMSERRAVISQMSRLIAHLLKWKYQPHLRGNSWKISINQARDQILIVTDESKNLQKELPEIIQKSYKYGVKWAANEMGIELKKFPQKCPFTLEQCLDENFWPE